MDELMKRIEVLNKRLDTIMAQWARDCSFIQRHEWEISEMGKELEHRGEEIKKMQGQLKILTERISRLEDTAGILNGS